MKTIYVVTSGEYSDFRTHGAFLTQEAAEAAISLGYGSSSSYGGEVMEMMLYEGDEQPEVGESVSVYQEVTPDGSTTEMVVRSERVVHDPVGAQRVDTHEHKNIRGFAFVATSYDREGAVKSVADRVAKKRAEILEL